MNHRTLVPALAFVLLVSLSFPASTSHASSNSRLAEILRLPVLQATDWRDLFALAESGEPEAQYWLGVVYQQGRLLPLDREKANFWLQKSADQGYPRAVFWLCGQRAGRDEIEGERCLWRAAEDGVPEAQLWIGVFFRDNRFGVTDEQASLNWFHKAANGGNVDAEAELGFRYEIGDGVEQDFSQAAYWFRRAAEHVPDLGGASKGRNNLGILYEIGEGVPQDYVQAYMWLRLAGVQENIAQIEKQMTAEQISQGKQLADEWEKEHPDPAIY